MRDHNARAISSRRVICDNAVLKRRCVPVVDAAAKVCPVCAEGAVVDFKRAAVGDASAFASEAVGPPTHSIPADSAVVDDQRTRVVDPAANSAVIWVLSRISSDSAVVDS